MTLLGVIFDFDGVIADTEPLHLRAYQEVLANTDVTLTRDAYESRYLGFDDVGVFTTIAQDQGVALSADKLAHLIDAKGRRYNELVGTEDVVFPAARACIKRLGRTVVLGIASGALHHEIEDILIAARLRPHFSALVAADDVERSKPAPDTYARATELLCGALGRPPSPAGFVAIEDSSWGIESARAAGLPCVGVATTYGADALSSATLVVPSLAYVNAQTLGALT